MFFFTFWRILDHQTFSTMRYFPPWGILRTPTFLGEWTFPPRDTLVCIFSTMRSFLHSFNSLALDWWPAPEIWKSWKKGITFLLRITCIKLIQNKSLTPTPTLHKQVTPCISYFPKTDIFGCQEFSAQRQPWLQLFWPSDIFHHEEFSTQLQFPGSQSFTSS